MAYISTEEKQKIAKALKNVIPKDWKWSTSAPHHSTFCLTIQSAPIDLVQIYIDELNKKRDDDRKNVNYGNIDLNVYWYKDTLQEQPELVKIFDGIISTIKSVGEWFDHSDAMTDYFHTAFYIDVKLGKWNKPFIVK